MAQINETVDFLRERAPAVPEAVLVLGSGLGDVAEEIEAAVRVPYTEIPGFPIPPWRAMPGRWCSGGGTAYRWRRCRAASTSTRGGLRSWSRSRFARLPRLVRVW